MKFSKNIARGAGALAVAAVVVVAAVASAGPPDGKGGGKGKNKPPPPVESPEPDPDPDPPPSTSVDADDVEFVEMMIPHHFQATVMGDMATSQAGTEEIRAWAERISVEQDVEIGMMQNWQTWNGLDVTDAESAYEMMLGMPMMMEQMGMASPEELDQLSASSGADFDRMYLELMITHHEGAIDMLVEVITDGSDDVLSGWATEMLTTQTWQVEEMRIMLDEMS
ncbi:DUF305 domain-containing protein [Salsipaludibacter albus]|uniref:DUF305 domain-containing protein n=1 Tax=Salsipaludibacter albus TaxID=2849650 RepID=UPI001EE44FBC|nr:DUF305 domain-containing protein [Salsipaludibacter albus]MBY5161399.1 DUF305 domain-containing protein [Salsipaludibacter albus]